jgi:ribonuclease P protein component
MASEEFPKSARLRKRREFLAVQGRGTKASGEHLTALARPAASQRLGLTVSTKVGNAVERAQVKRWLREVFRKNRALLPVAEVVLIARPSAKDAGLANLARDVDRIGRALKAKLGSGVVVKKFQPAARPKR